MQDLTRKMFEPKIYYQAYAFDIMDPEQREELNKLLEKYQLAQPMDKVITEGHCTVFCLFEITKPVKLPKVPVVDLSEEKPIVINKEDTKKEEPEDKNTSVFEEPKDTTVNKLLSEVKGHESYKKEDKK